MNKALLPEETVYLSADSVARRYDASKSSVWRWIKEGKLPKPVKILTGLTRWKLADLEAWEAEQGGRI